MATKFGFVRVSGGVTMLGAFSVRATKSVSSPVIVGGALIEGKNVSVTLDPGTYWARLVLAMVENLSGIYNYQVTINGTVVDSDCGDANVTSGKDSKASLRWVKFTV